MEPQGSQNAPSSGSGRCAGVHCVGGWRGAAERPGCVKVLIITIFFVIVVGVAVG